MSDRVDITVYGRGGHAAMPHNTIDPIVLAARIVLALQTVVSRENNPVDPVVVTVGSDPRRHAGQHHPGRSEAAAVGADVTRHQVRTRTLAAIRRIAKGEAESRRRAARASGRRARRGHAARLSTIRRSCSRLAGALKKGLGEQNVVEMPEKMTSEDFAEYGLAGVPSRCCTSAPSIARSWTIPPNRDSGARAALT